MDRRLTFEFIKIPAMSLLTRKKFIISSIAVTGSMVLVPRLITAQQLHDPVRPQKGPPLDKTLVKEFVTVAHHDLAKVKTMLQETPDLLHAAYDWKSWDWEDAIGAAGHMGLRDMAMYLLEQGARPTICVAAMLGNLDVVKTFITAFPHMKNSLGPHKITLLSHAVKGGEQAKPVVEYLHSMGITQ
jgi:hypothetical protein